MKHRIERPGQLRPPNSVIGIPASLSSLPELSFSPAHRPSLSLTIVGEEFSSTGVRIRPITGNLFVTWIPLTQSQLRPALTVGARNFA